jgi:hypothetical protein
MPKEWERRRIQETAPFTPGYGGPRKTGDRIDAGYWILDPGRWKNRKIEERKTEGGNRLRRL